MHVLSKLVVQAVGALYSSDFFQPFGRNAEPCPGRAAGDVGVRHCSQSCQACLQDVGIRLTMSLLGSNRRPMSWDISCVT